MQRTARGPGCANLLRRSLHASGINLFTDADPLGLPTQCRNDGKRNFREGRIRRAEYEAIERRNAELDVELAELLAKERV